MANEIKILPGMNMLDAAIASGGSMEDLFAMALLNGLAVTEDLTAGTILQGTGNNYQVVSLGTLAERNTNVVKVKNGQTLFDLAIQESGSMEDAFALAVLNGLPLSEELETGTPLNYLSLAADKKIRKQFQDNNWKPASSGLIAGQGAPGGQLEGVDYWAIQIDFIVS